MANLARLVAIMRRLRERSREDDGDKSTASIIVEAAAGIRRSIVFATLVILVALAPLLFVGGRAGELLRPVALSYALAIVVSTVLAFLVPSATARKPIREWSTRITSRLVATAEALASSGTRGRPRD